MTSEDLMMLGELKGRLEGLQIAVNNLRLDTAAGLNKVCSALSNHESKEMEKIDEINKRVDNLRGSKMYVWGILSTITFISGIVLMIWSIVGRGQ